MNEITKFANSFRNNNNTIQMYPARVISVDDNYSKATVELMSDIGSELTLLNKTGEKLNGGDSVWVFYKNNINSGWIGLKNSSTGNYFLDSLKFKQVTESEYKNLSEPDINTFYVINKGNAVDIYLGKILVNNTGGGSSSTKPVSISVYTQSLTGYVSAVEKEEI